MNTHSTMLIAVMDTPSAMHAGGQGLALAASMGARVVGVSVTPPYEGNMNRLHVQDLQQSIEAPHRAALDRLAEMAAKANVPFRSELVEGKSYEAIADMAEAEGADLIVLGGVSRNRLERSLLSPTSERIIGYARRDVLVIPEGSQVDFSRILLATDGSANCGNATARALDLARAYGGALRAITVIDVPPDYHLYDKVMGDMGDQARTCLDHVGRESDTLHVPAETFVRQGRTAETIIGEAEDMDASLIVVGTHGHTGLKRLMLGSVAAEVLRRNRFPVLVVP